MERILLGDVLEEVTEKTTRNNQYPVLTAAKSGLYLQQEYFNKQVASKDNTGYKIIRKGQFSYRAMSDTGEFFPNLLECAEVGIVSPAYPVFRNINLAKVTNEYLKYYFKSTIFQNAISRFAQGSTRTSVKFSKLKTITVKIPDIEEQKKVAGVLDAATALATKRRRQLALLDTLTQSRFVEMFGDTPEQECVTMEEICAIITDGTHQPPQFEQSGIPFLFVSNITNDELTYEAEKFISEKTYEELIKRTPIEIGDILLSTVGSYGHVAIVKSDRKFCFQRHIAYLKPKAEIVNSEYLRAAILSQDVQRQIDARVKGIAQKTLNLSEIRKLKLPLPAMESQNEFSEFVSEVDRQKAALRRSLTALTTLKSALLQEYFGE